MRMQHEVWQRLVALESRDAVVGWHNEITGRTLGARRAQEITSASRQAREFFRSASSADRSVSPLLGFYGVTSLSRATTLLLKANGGEETLTQAHGLETVGWSGVLQSDVASGIGSIAELEVRTTAGLFMDFIRETANRMCIHVRSSGVDWQVPYGLPPSGDTIKFGDLLSRLPDLASEHSRSSETPNYAYVSQMAYSAEAGFEAKAARGTFEPFKADYESLGYEVATEGENVSIHGTTSVFADALPQLMHSYARKMFGTIPSLYIVKPLPTGSRYSQMAVTYLLSFFLGMLARYYPTHWVALYSGHKGDRRWPEISMVQTYVDTVYPELINEFILESVRQATLAPTVNATQASV